MTDEEIMKNLKQYFFLALAGDISIENGLVSYSGNVKLLRKINILPLKFKRVGGNFYCSHNQLTSLRGAPQSVGGDFWCYDNQLTSLRGAPQSVGGDFYCNICQLTSLAGAPQSVGGDFDCSGNQLTSLAGAPRYVHQRFSCRNNPLASLTGAPQYVGEDLLLTYAERLALLPLLMIKGCKQVEFWNADDKIQHKSLSEILNRYLGTGTQGILACAEEMIEAGYGSNAHYD